MPVLSTFGGASARSFGRAIDVQPPIFPAGTTVMWNENVSAGLPSGWQYLQEADQRFILGTTNGNEIGDTLELQGVANLTTSFTSLSSGSHDGTFFATSRIPSSTGGFSSQKGSGGSHNHTISPTVNLTSPSHTNNSNISPYLDIPFIYTTTEQDTLPPNAIVFRGNTPSSTNYQLLDDVRGLPTSLHAFRCAQTIDFSTKDELRWLNGGLSGTNGNHSHPSEKRASGSLTNTVYTYDSSSQNHQHQISVQCRLRVKSKRLQMWTSFFQESLQSGMMVMYIGNVSNLPSGWRICNGSNGTPDMGTYYLGYSGASGDAHNYVLSSSNLFEFNDANLDDFTWTHTHRNQSFTTTSSSSSASHHTTSPIHGHDVTASTLRIYDQATTPYIPPSFKLCFIQYKGL